MKSHIAQLQGQLVQLLTQRTVENERVEHERLFETWEATALKFFGNTAGLSLVDEAGGAGTAGGDKVVLRVWASQAVARELTNRLLNMWMPRENAGDDESHDPQDGGPAATAKEATEQELAARAEEANAARKTTAVFSEDCRIVQLILDRFLTS